MQYPLRVEAFEVRRGSGGPGKWRGGDGIVRRLRALAACEGTLLGDRRGGRPYGLQGGGPGAAGEDGAAGRRLGGKARFSLLPGDALEIETPGGGGWGKP